MNCLEFQERLQALLDSRQDIADDPAIGEHMAGCADCEALATAYTMAVRVPLRIADHEPMEGLADRVLAEVNRPVAHTQPAANHRRSGWMQWAVALAACLLVALGVIRQNQDASVGVPQPTNDTIVTDVTPIPYTSQQVEVPGGDMWYRTGQGLASFSLVGMQSSGNQSPESENPTDSQLLRRALDTLRVIWPGTTEGGSGTQGETGFLEPPTYAMVS